MSYSIRTYYRFPGSKKWLDKVEFYEELFRRYGEGLKPEHLNGVQVLEEIWFFYDDGPDLIESCKRPIKEEEKKNIVSTILDEENREFFEEKKFTKKRRRR